MMKTLTPLLAFFMPVLLLADPGDSTSVDTDSLIVEAWTFEDDPFAQRLDSLMTSILFSTNAPQGLDSVVIAEEAPIVADSIIAARMAHLNSQSPFELVYNDEVKRYIELYANRRREQVSRMLGLAEYYFPLFEQALDKYDMPLELKYLAIVESALNPNARSRVGAKGLWQFMYATGRMQGLQVSSYVDERSDPYKSTEAACDYLMKLYQIFDDWNLALAAYNSGPGNVNRAIRRSGGQKDYWAIRPWLPRETAGYVPAFIAVNYVMNYAEDHGLYSVPSILSFYETDTIEVKGQLHFEQIAQMTGADMATLEILNPSYRHKIIPKVEGQRHYLVLPREQMGVFITHEDSIYTLAQAQIEAEEVKEPDYQEMNERLVHRVRGGESLGLIGEKYGVSVRQLQSWNGLRGTTIRIGQRLIVYPRRLPNTTSSSSPTTPTSSNGVVRYTVRSGDTLYEIARRYPGVSADNIMDWNNIRSASSLRPGQTLEIRTQ